MSICIPAATAEGLSAAVFGHFGSAPYFVIHDPDTRNTDVIENGNAHHAQGGCQPLAAVEGHDVDALVICGIGARAIQRLNASGVKVYRAIEGTVAENLEKLAAGSLVEMAPELGCAGHHGDARD